MEKKKNTSGICYPKSIHKHDHKSIEQKVRAQLGPLLKIPKSHLTTSSKNIQKKATDVLSKSNRFSSPPSCHSSELLSKNHSRQKLNIFKMTNDQRKDSRMKKKTKIITQSSYEQMKMNESMNKTVIGKRKKVQAQNDHKENKELLKLKWKNSILQRFVLDSQSCEKCRGQKLSSLEDTLKNYMDEDSSSSSKTMFKFAINETLNQYGNTQNCLIGYVRVLTVDWMYLISASLLLNRETVHLAVHYLDSYLSQCGETNESIHLIASACLYLSVKQEERFSQNSLLDLICLSEKMQIQREQIIEMEQNILIRLNFKLKANTLAFWIDYFASKWDSFVNSSRGIPAFQQTGIQTIISLKDPFGNSYKLYRSMVQLGDCCLMFGQNIAFMPAKLALACIYLVLRIEIQKQQQKSTNKQNIQQTSHHKQQTREGDTSKGQNLFKFYHREFLKKASPIFRDPFRINELFNCFLTELCEFEITEIIPVIKYISTWLDIEFSYNIDKKAFEETDLYEDFIRKMTYSVGMKDYALAKVQ